MYICNTLICTSSVSSNCHFICWLRWGNFHKCSQIFWGKLWTTWPIEAKYKMSCKEMESAEALHSLLQVFFFNPIEKYWSNWVKLDHLPKKGGHKKNGNHHRVLLVTHVYSTRKVQQELICSTRIPCVSAKICFSMPLCVCFYPTCFFFETALKLHG